MMAEKRDSVLSVMDKECSEVKTFAGVMRVTTQFYEHLVRPLIEKAEPRKLKFAELIRNYDPVYLVTRDWSFACWVFYSGYVAEKKTMIFRDPDGNILDFKEGRYGKSWVCYSAKVQDDELEEVEWDA